MALRRIFLHHLSLLLPCVVSLSFGEPPTPGEQSAAPLTDEAFFETLDLERPGLQSVRRAVARQDLDAAKQELADYYRKRSGAYHYIDGQNPVESVSKPEEVLRSSRDLVQRTGSFDAKLWTGDRFDWPGAEIRRKERMYFLEAFGKAAAVEDGNEVATALVHLIRSFAAEYHSPPEKTGGMWATMDAGIRMRTGWPVAFLCLLQSPSFTDEDLIVFLKSVWDQTDYLRKHRSNTSNWLTFEMAGLYTSGIVYPEFKDAKDWRRIACETALKELERGWLPDGMTVEFSPGYGQFFSNYFVIHDLARHVGRLDEFGIAAFPERTEPLYEAYLAIMTPDRLTPATNDNNSANVVKLLGNALEHFPDRDNFRWVATDGAEGSAPSFTSVILPYAGFAAMRSGWERRDHLLYFDFGPVGYRHAHQDGLNVILWSHGRQILFDPGLVNYDHSNPMVAYNRDTFSHNTVLVDNRPQRRPWYNDSHPKQMPYEEVPGYRWETTDRYDFAAGVYKDAYGLPGPSNSYPYSDESDFREGWSRPAEHHRRVLFWKPDVFIVADTLLSRDDEAHEYDLRWHLDSTRVRLAADGATIVTGDEDRPNLELAPLFTDDLEVRVTSAQKEPEILGWNSGDPDNVKPATTIQHLKYGAGTKSFLTLLLPLDRGQISRLQSWTRLDDACIEVELSDGRRLLIDAPHDPAGKLTVTDQTAQ